MAGYKLTEAINWKAWTGKVLQAIKNVSVNVGDVTVNTSDLEALQTTTNTKLDTVNSNLDEIEGAVETIETAIGTDGAAGPAGVLSVGGTDSAGRIQELSVDTSGRLMSGTIGFVTAQPFATSIGNNTTLDATTTPSIGVDWSNLTITNTAVTGDVTVQTTFNGAPNACVIPPGFSITFDCGANQFSFRSSFFTQISTDANSTALIVGAQALTS